MLLAEIAAAVDDVTSTSSRTAKTERLAQTLRDASADEIPVVVAYLAGELRQRRTGIGWRSMADPPAPASAPSLTVADVDAAFEAAQAVAGQGSQAGRRQLVTDLLSRATEAEQHLLTALVGGELRQGAARGVLTDAVARAAGVPLAVVRRAVTLSGDLAEVASAALTAQDAAAAEQVLSGFGLTVGRPLSPMLAQSAPTMEAALERTGPASVEWKLDGIRVQVHATAGRVSVWTRTLDEITERVPEVVAAVQALGAGDLVADGEVIALDGPDLHTARPLPFQETASRVATRTAKGTTPLTTVLFDVLHADGEDLLDEPYERRRGVLERIAPALAVPAVRADGQAFFDDALARGHEGVVVKALDAPYAMGRRGAAWVKVKRRTTFDLVVLAAEWGHGRRTGKLSNLHLGARDPDGAYGPPGGFVMLGKTFKGMTDELLAWQTKALNERAVHSTTWRVDVRPELVVEIAVDGVQSSPRYPAGMALRFARVLRYRPDKRAHEADTVAAVREFHEGNR
ncbi:MAG TPA: ATP-dependent DNA ligase [Actinomycetales bacterium]|nr:ATP-dependent DNA ligase [Actinomycetales bacterium]